MGTTQTLPTSSAKMDLGFPVLQAIQALETLSFLA